MYWCPHWITLIKGFLVKKILVKKYLDSKIMSNRMAWCHADGITLEILEILSWHFMTFHLVMMR